MNKHTPGPWTVYSTGEIRNYAGRQVTCEDAFDVGVSVSRGQEENEANRQLAMAAPDLLEVVKDCKTALAVFLNGCGADEIKDSFYDMETAVTKARAAIAKAEGR